MMTMTIRLVDDINVQVGYIHAGVVMVLTNERDKNVFRA